MKQNNYLFVLLMMFNSSLFAEDIKANMTWAELQKVGFAVNGVVESVAAKVGDKVKTGDVLAQLDAEPFNYHVQHCQAAIEKVQPAVFDAKIALDQAEELFERTVLSEVELSEVDGAYKALKAEESMLKAECDIKQWQTKRAVIKAKKSVYILSSNIYPGMIISSENKSTATIELVSATKASAESFVSAKQALQYKVNDQVNVIVDGRAIVGIIESISMQPNAANQYLLTAVFHYAQKIEQGKAINIKL